ncbi:uncharacterized protein LOC124163407 [Ischnura elegans]|uniref:uncharacterized protein LOC124163407 n=1 Tax=Ischnura elegans TaxID=197161 RepID=UPI001ED87E68|nr:uncharacterized protein LOC124163407 [Ischnura elegans]
MDGALSSCSPHLLLLVFATLSIVCPSAPFLLRVDLGGYRRQGEVAPSSPLTHSVARDVISDPLGLYAVCADVPFPQDIECDLSLVARSETWARTRGVVVQAALYYAHPDGHPGHHCGVVARGLPGAAAHAPLRGQRVYCSPALKPGARPALNVSDVHRVLLSVSKVSSAKPCDMSFVFAGVITDRPSDGEAAANPLVKFLYNGGDCDGEESTADVATATAVTGGEEEGEVVDALVVTGKLQVVTHLGKAYPDY